MAMKRIVVSLLVAGLLAIIVIGASLLEPREAEAAPTTVATCDGGTIQLNDNEKRMLELHNTARKKRGLRKLCVHPILTEAARAHTQEMLDKDYSSDLSYNGETTRERLERFGYPPEGYSSYYYGENIAWGCESYGAPERIFRWWMHTSEHRKNILNKRLREVGLGVMTGTYKSCDQATMYTVDFATPRR